MAYCTEAMELHNDRVRRFCGRPGHNGSERCAAHTPGTPEHARTMFELLLALSDVEVMMGGNILQNLSDIYRLVASSLDAPKSVPSDVRFDGYRRAIQTAAGAAYMQLRSVDKAELWGFAARRTLRRGHFTGVGKGSP